ncbi:hypothetical protein E2C01_080558 [Portunus trituberculatus]|uniref:Uncharacterized protein n=1 Tax=Portunus trituberculatus TaxID=210409 RepID=A0A5B7IVQ4_PORTR|nr:hypothetical protein [Portunus trituberculatus]
MWRAGVICPVAPALAQLHFWWISSYLLQSDEQWHVNP